MLHIRILRPQLHDATFSNILGIYHVSRKDRTGGGGRVHLKGERVNYHGHVCEKPLVRAG